MNRRLRPVASPSSGVREWGPGVPRRLLGAAALAVAVTCAGGARAGTIPGQYIVVLKDTVPDPHAVAAEHARAWGARPRFVYRHALKGYAARLSPAALSAIEADRRVHFISEDGEVFAVSTCDPSNFNPAVQCLPSGIDRIDSERSSTRSGNGRGAVNINVAVLDSGINLNHPDLNVVGGVGCLSKTFDDPAGHGTHLGRYAAGNEDSV